MFFLLYVLIIYGKIIKHFRANVKSKTDCFPCLKTKFVFVILRKSNADIRRSEIWMQKNAVPASHGALF